MSTTVNPQAGKSADDRALLRSWAYVLAVPNINTTAAYFRDKLGFSVDWKRRAEWRLVERGGVRIMLGQCPKAMTPAETGDHNWFAFLDVDDVDALHEEFVERGAIILAPPADKPSGLREMLVGTSDGHRIMVGQRL
jgi:predicted enzyme related to lactoylglutathione lyase